MQSIDTDNVGTTNCSEYETFRFMSTLSVLAWVDRLYVEKLGRNAYVQMSTKYQYKNGTSE